MTTLNTGTEFEKDVAVTLRMIPGSLIKPHQRISGKELDLLCTIPSLIGAPQRIAVECKDYGRRLSRELVAQVLADYWPLLEQRAVDQVLLVTRNGLVANAHSTFDGVRTVHATLNELRARVLAPEPLLKNMRALYEGDLANYYIDSRGQSVNLTWVSQHFEAMYSDFIYFTLQYKRSSFENAARKWAEMTEGTPEADQAGLYTPSLYEAVLEEHKKEGTEQLLPLVEKWVHSEDFQESLALIGSYGTGKSSFARRLASEFAVRYEEGRSSRIPILIELRNFGGHQDVESLILHELHRRHGLSHWSYETFRQLNESGGLLLVLDGFDEMKHGLTREALFYNFDQLSRLSQGNARVLICGRPTAFASDDEQVAVLTGKPAAYMERKTRYIQVPIAPFTKDDIFLFLRRFADWRKTATSKVVERKLQQLADLIAVDHSVEALLRRPVHLPMIAELLPALDINSKSLKRASIYQQFIDQLINRQVRRQRSPDPSREKHWAFSEELALLMLSHGESRAVRFSEIPDDLMERFQAPGQPMDECRRQFVSASFLERKPPDILYFPHKSWAEFLGAKALLRRVSDGDDGTYGLDSAITPEVLSFITEMATLAQYRHLGLRCEEYEVLLGRLIGAGDPRLLGVLTEEDIVESLAEKILIFPKPLAFHVVNAWGMAGRRRLDKPQSELIIKACEQLRIYGGGALSAIAQKTQERWRVRAKS